jgi:hypothetical protein
LAFVPPELIRGGFARLSGLARACGQGRAGEGSAVTASTSSKAAAIDALPARRSEGRRNSTAASPAA